MAPAAGASPGSTPGSTPGQFRHRLLRLRLRNRMNRRGGMMRPDTRHTTLAQAHEPDGRVLAMHVPGDCSPVLASTTGGEPAGRTSPIQRQATNCDNKAENGSAFVPHHDEDNDPIYLIIHPARDDAGVNNEHESADTAGVTCSAGTSAYSCIGAHGRSSTLDAAGSAGGETAVESTSDVVTDGGAKRTEASCNIVKPIAMCHRNFQQCFTELVGLYDTVPRKISEDSDFVGTNNTTPTSGHCASDDDVVVGRGYNEDGPPAVANGYAQIAAVTRGGRGDDNEANFKSGARSIHNSKSDVICGGESTCNSCLYGASYSDNLSPDCTTAQGTDAAVAGSVRSDGEIKKRGVVAGRDPSSGTAGASEPAEPVGTSDGAADETADRVATAPKLEAYYATMLGNTSIVTYGHNPLADDGNRRHSKMANTSELTGYTLGAPSSHGTSDSYGRTHSAPSSRRRFLDELRDAESATTADENQETMKPNPIYPSTVGDDGSACRVPSSTGVCDEDQEPTEPEESNAASVTNNTNPCQTGGTASVAHRADSARDTASVADKPETTGVADNTYKCVGANNKSTTWTDQKRSLRPSQCFWRCQSTSTAVSCFYSSTERM